MKRLLKLILGMLIGFIMGFAGIAVAIVLFSDLSFSSYLEKMVSIDIFTLLGVILTSLISFILSLFIQITLHEGGHLVCGLATGYSFVSFRIGSLTIIKKDGRLLVKRFSIAGTGGQCLLSPPLKPLNEIPIVWYNMGGILANLLTASIALIFMIFIDKMPSYLFTFLLLFSITGFFLALTNGIPMKIGGIGNDADNMRLLLKSSESKLALMTQLRVNALLQEGIRLKDMPNEWFQEEEDTDYKNALQTTVQLLVASRFEDMGDFDKAYTIFNDCLQHKDEIIGLLVKEIKCELLLIALIKGYTEQVDELLTDDTLAYINQYKKVMSSKQTLLCALALYQENNPNKAKEIYDTVCQQKDKYLMQGEVQMSITLMQTILAK